jgi:translocation and assembly module TamB
MAVIDSFSLGILQIFELTGDINGYLEGNVELGGTVSTPDPQGNIRLFDANIIIDEYGIDYDKIKLNLNFLKNSVVLDTFYVSSNKGSLTGGGKIDFSSGFYKGDVSHSEIQLEFDEFKLLDHNQFNMEVSGNASIGGKEGNVVFDGDLEIPQAELYLPAVLSMMGRINTPEMPKPILVRRAESMQVSLDSLGIITFKAATPDSVRFTYFDQFEGQLRIKIPKNTWVKNEDMRVEISGDLELIKNKDFFELFGTVEIVRGQYDLLGKTFVITDGSITFQGGEEILPRLNINATYSFRNRGSAQQELAVQITGTTESPEVKFTLDGSSISEGDALSYILFGKGMNELTMNEQQNVEGAGGGSLAEEAAASVLSSQITSFLGDKLNVDYIEVKSEDGFANASVVVGKYITNDLFVSYEQRFGETDEKDIAKYEVKLEYELFRFLFFELNNASNDSGFDVIVKFDVE